MGFQMQGGATFIYWLMFAIIIGLSIASVYVIYRLGGLPGRVAASRKHPQTAAIAVCGWLGLLVFVLWPLALIWAYMAPKDQLQGDLITADELNGLLAGIHQLADRIAAIERNLAPLEPMKVQ